MTTPDDTQDSEFVNAFNGGIALQPKGSGTSTSPGYGIDPRQADFDAMASAFDSPDVEVGKPMMESAIEAEPLPELPDESQSSQAPVEMEAKAAEPAERPAVMPEFKTFGQAFKWHREQALKNGGPKVFDWKGEKKHIMIKSEWDAMQAAKKAKAEASQKAQEAKQFEAAFVNRDKPAVKTTGPATVPAAGKAPPAIDRYKTLAIAAPATTAPTGQLNFASASTPVEPLHIRQQKAYDEWQRQLSDSKTWWGGQAILGPGQKERLQEAEKNFDKLISQTR